MPAKTIQGRRFNPRRPSSEDDPHPNQATIYRLIALIAPQTNMAGYVLVGVAATGDVASNSSDQRQLFSPAPALIQRRLDDRPGRGKAPPEVSSVAKNHHHHHIRRWEEKHTTQKISISYQKSFEVKNKYDSQKFDRADYKVDVASSRPTAHHETNITTK
jgi:hypothetical protein